MMLIVPCFGLCLLKGFPLVRKHPKRTDFNYWFTTKEKRGCLQLPAPSIAAYHSLAERTNRETTTLRHIDNRKVCVEDTRPSQHTTENIYYTPWSYPGICLGSAYRLWQFRWIQKQSVSNAFQYVVPHPAAPSSSEEFMASIGRQQVQRYKKVGNNDSFE